MAKSWRLSSASLQRNGRGACVHRHGHAAWYPAGVERMRTCICGGGAVLLPRLLGLPQAECYSKVRL